MHLLCIHPYNSTSGSLQPMDWVEQQMGLVSRVGVSLVLHDVASARAISDYVRLSRTNWQATFFPAAASGWGKGGQSLPLRPFL
jgi:hypothetical protein